MTSWECYWKRVHAQDPAIRSPFDIFVDRLVRHARGRWLDAGCGRRSLPEWRSEELGRLREAGVTLFGCDVDLLALRERRDPGSVCAATLDELPFADASFDFVSANMVFEHLVKPEITVRELARVTKPGGRILVHTVNGLHYLSWIARLTPHRFHQWIVELIEGRAGKDVYPTQYRANTVGRLRRLFEEAACRFVDGGLIDGTPLYIPYPGLFHLAIQIGIFERRLARLPGLRKVLCPNLLLEFERTSSVSIDGHLAPASERSALGRGRHGGRRSGGGPS